MAVLLPAMEPCRAQAGVARAEHLGGRCDAGLEGRQRRHHLEGRARRVLAADAFVDQRRARVVAQLAPDARPQAAGERRRVVARHRGQRQHAAGAHVDHDGTGRQLAGQPRHAETLQLEVEAQLEVVAGLALAAVELADLAADRVDLDPAEPGAAAQRAVVAALDPALADAELRQLQQRIVVRGLLGRADGADIAQDVGQDRRRADTRAAGRPRARRPAAPARARRRSRPRPRSDPRAP